MDPGEGAAHRGPRVGHDRKAERLEAVDWRIRQDHQRINLRPEALDHVRQEGPSVKVFEAVSRSAGENSADETSEPKIEKAEHADTVRSVGAVRKPCRRSSATARPPCNDEEHNRRDERDHTAGIDRDIEAKEARKERGDAIANDAGARRDGDADRHLALKPVGQEAGGCRRADKQGDGQDRADRIERRNGSDCSKDEERGVREARPKACDRREGRIKKPLPSTL